MKKDNVVEFNRPEKEEEQPTVKHYVQELYELSQLRKITMEETNSGIDIDSFQDLIFHNVDALSDLLGIELED